MSIEAVDIGAHNLLPLVSVVIPTYNSATFIVEAVKSVFNQSYQNIEIIVIDDGSTDGTELVLKPYRDRIIYHKKSSNEGLARARNTGMRLATGSYIAWLDADDICATDRVLVQAAYLSYDPNVDLVCSEFTAFEGNTIFNSAYGSIAYPALKGESALKEIFPKQLHFDGVTVSWLERPLPRSYEVYSGQVWERLMWGNFIHPPTVMMRKAACQRAGELREDCPRSEDYEYFVRIAEKGNVAFINEALLWYRCHDEQMSGAKHSEGIEKANIDVYEILLEKYPQFHAKNRKSVDRRLAYFYSSAAREYADSNPGLAVQYCLKSARIACDVREIIPVLARIILPRSVKKVLKSHIKRPLQRQLKD